MRTRAIALAATSVLAAAVLAACGQSSGPGTEPRLIQIDGSSTVFPITEAVAEEFQLSQRGEVRVTVGVSGTGGGFKKFCRGEIDIADASRAISATEVEACTAAGIEFVELPIAYDAITVAVHPDNDWVDQITIEELRRMWGPAAQGTVTKWSQVNPAWPDAELKLYGPGADSGTFDYFTEVVVGEAKSSRGDFTASEDDNVLVQGVEADSNALAYFGYAYYAANSARMKALKIVNGQGVPVGPSEATVLDGSYEPLSRPVFIYVSKAAAQRPEVRAFVEYFLTEAAPLVQEVRYVPLQPEVYEEQLAKFHSAIE